MASAKSATIVSVIVILTFAGLMEGRSEPVGAVVVVAALIVVVVVAGVVESPVCLIEVKPGLLGV